MSKSVKFLSVFLIAMIVLSAGGLFASYLQGKDQTAQVEQAEQAAQAEQVAQEEKSAETTVTKQLETTEKIETTIEKTTIKETTKATTKANTISVGTTVNTGYPYNYAGVNPEQTEITDDNWNLMLINADNYLPESYDFKLAVAIEGYPAKLDERVVGYYKDMYDAAKKVKREKSNGYITLSPTSVNGGYRLPEKQQELFEQKIARFPNDTRLEAVRKASLINQPPRCSEHNAGLAMDIGTTNNFEYTEEFAWLSENAADYGFIMRYQASKSAITGVMYEPWHWRFVGVKDAKAIKASGLCFEEYYETL
jgi:D-alanyl-D-alanine carboxypeptidase